MDANQGAPFLKCATICAEKLKKKTKLVWVSVQESVPFKHLTVEICSPHKCLDFCGNLPQQLPKTSDDVAN